MCFEIKRWETLIFVLKIILSIWSSLWFHTEFWNCFFYFYENDINILIDVAINLYLGSGSIEISTVLTKSPVYEHGMSCQFLVPCSTFSVWCVVFSELVVSLWRPCVPPSLISESVVEGWACEEMWCPSLPPHRFSDDAQHRHPGLCVHICPFKRNTCREFL